MHLSGSCTCCRSRSRGGGKRGPLRGGVGLRWPSQPQHLTTVASLSPMLLRLHACACQSAGLMEFITSCQQSGPIFLGQGTFTSCWFRRESDGLVPPVDVHDANEYRQGNFSSHASRRQFRRIIRSPLSAGLMRRPRRPNVASSFGFGPTTTQKGSSFTIASVIVWARDGSHPACDCQGLSRAAFRRGGARSAVQLRVG